MPPQGACVSPLVARLLAARGVTEADNIDAFLAPKLATLVDPLRLRGMAEAVAAILGALDQGERVTIHGDYDVDGITSAAILWRFLRQSGFEPHVFLPDRFVDGYGINAARVRELVAEGTRLFISVDCGTSAMEAITVARDLGAGFVVIDHHQLPDGPLPPATAFVNPHQPDCDFPDKRLCAAGLAFHLAVALRKALRERGHFTSRAEPDLRELLDLVALGTIADVVPLQGINRVLVAAGLERMEKSPHAGLRALMSVAGVSGRPTAVDVGYKLGPRLNAAGRLSHPMKSFELLATDDLEIAQQTAKAAHEENEARRQVERHIQAEAVAQAETDLTETPDRAALVLWDPGWHPGVSGIVASRIVERFHRPCAVIALVDGVGKGSLRSITGFDLVDGLRQCAEHLTQWGGHPHAAGLSIAPERLPAFREAFDQAARTRLRPEHFAPVLRHDGEVSLSEVDERLVLDLDRLAPYGAANAEPLFVARDVRVMEARVIGKDKTHLRLVVAQDGVKLSAVAFGLAEHAPEPGARLDVAFRPELNDYPKGQALTLQLRIVDFRPVTLS